MLYACALFGHGVKACVSGLVLKKKKEGEIFLINFLSFKMLDLRNMDCMELMAQFADKHFDIAIVDPPYGIGKVARNGQGIAVVLKK